MIRLWMILYNLIFIPFSLIVTSILSLVNPKIRKGLSGRVKILKKVRKDLVKIGSHQPRIICHVSSYGEFLQGKPVFEQLKQLNPNLFIIVTVFSPSGYENITVQPPIDYLCYLPIDSYFGMKKFISIISPDVAVIVRHDIWPNFIWQLKKRNIPLILIDASLSEKSSHFYPVLRNLSRLQFNQFDSIMAITDEEANRFRRLIGKQEKIEVIGDTKYDQVYERSKFRERFSRVSRHPALKNKKILIAGSTWGEDEAIIIPAFQKITTNIENVMLIIAPHEPTPRRIDEIKLRCEKLELKPICLTELDKGKHDFDCLIIDQIGLLANIYSLGMAAFVGGSFHTKIHNVLEPAVYGVPVFFGPKMTNSAEAKTLIQNNAAIIVYSIDEVYQLMMKFIQKPEFGKTFGKRAKEIVMNNVGSSRKIAQNLLTIMSKH